MLKLYYKLGQMRFSSLMTVYEEGNREKAREKYGYLPEEAGLQQAEQDFYRYLADIFFPTSDSVYAVWEEGGQYRSALRLEPYRDGLLLSALETAPESRRKGYGKLLVQAVLREIPNRKIYSHVHKKNVPSLALHTSCGFQRISETAAYLDGSVNNRCCTLVYVK